MNGKKIVSLILSVLMICSVLQPCIAFAASPSVGLDMTSEVVKGSGEIIECTAEGITDPVYTWVSDDPTVASVTGYGKTAFVKYISEGTANITVTVTGSEGTVTDSAEVNVTGDVPNPWDEVIPADEWTYYQLVDYPQNGKEYLVVNSNTTGSYTAISNTLKNDRFTGVGVTVNVGSERSDNKLYISDPAASCIWTVSYDEYVSENDAYYLRLNNNGYLAVTNKGKAQISTTVNDYSRWYYWHDLQYTDNDLQCYINDNTNYFFKLKVDKGVTYFECTNRIADSIKVYFYEKTDHSIAGETIHHDDVIPATYEPAVTFKYNNINADGKRYDLYETPVGTEIRLDGSYTGYAANGGLVSAAWASSDTNVATVENGIVTVTGTGITEISYTVTDGTTTFVKKVILNISQKGRPVETFVLTDHFEAGKQYAIVNANLPGSQSAVAMTSDVLEFSGNYNAIVRDVSPVELEGSGTDVSFMSENEKIIFTTETDERGFIYLKDYYGKYFTVNEYNVPGTSDYQLNFISLDSRTNASAFEYTGDGKIDSTVYSEGRYNPRTTWGVKISYIGNDYGYSYFCPQWTNDGTGVYIYEKVETAPLAKIKYNGSSVGGTGMTIYSVSDNSSLNLTGEYRNFPGQVDVVWSSSDESIATVDQNGFVQFTGEEGDVVISYTVTDVEDDTVRAASSVTFTATIQRDPKRIFKLTTEIVPGKNYIIVSSRSIGSCYVLNYDISANSSRALSGDYHVIQFDNSDGKLFVEIPDGELQNIWNASASTAAGYCYLVNEETGAYLYQTNNETNDGTFGTAALNTRNNAQYSWKSENGSPVTAGGYYPHWSDSSLYFRPAYESEGNNAVFIFEETELVPTVSIHSDYIKIDGKEVSRKNVCMYQTESLVGTAINFNTRKVNLVWSSDNDDVATVDPSTGILTYTGASGTVNVTVTAVSTVPDENGNYDTATASTSISVIGTGDGAVEGYRYMLTDKFVPGQIYAFAAYKTEGSHDVLNCWPSYDSNENVLWNNVCDFIQNSTTTYFDCDDKSVAWECIDAGNGYFYFKNEYRGYLVLYVRDTLRVVDATADVRGTGLESGIRYDNNNAYLFKQYDSANKKVCSLLSESSYSNYLSLGGSGQFRLSTDPTDIYIYRRLEDPNEAIKPAANIRHDAFGGNEILSNKLLTRNNVYDGMTERLLSYYEGFESVTGIEWTSNNPSIASIDENGLITYTGQEGVVTFAMEVSGTWNGETVTIKDMVSMVVSPDAYEAPSEDYPDFPHEGSVRINKTADSDAGGYNFQESGVAEVELSVTGVPMSKPVDVVIVFDHSSSMNYGNRLTNAINDTRDFALQVVNKNEKNRVAIVTFDRYVNQYQSYDSTTGTHTSHPASTENRIITGDGTPEGAFMTIDNATEMVMQIDGLQYNDIEGTNYDDGLEKAYKIVEAAKKDPNANEEQFVIFMSDGEPYAYNKLCITYPSNIDDENVYTAWLRGNESFSTIQTMLANPSRYPVIQYFHPEGKHWIAEAIKAPEGEDAGLPSAEYYDPYRTGLGAEIYSIGYSPDSFGNLTVQTLKNIATTPENMYSAQDNLQEVYDKILDSIIYAANEAVVTDKMGEYFNLQILPTFTNANGQQTITLDPEPYIEIGSHTLNSDGSRKESAYTEMEKITFEVNSGGVLTGAYSDQLSGNIFNAAQNKIIGKYVSYDFNTEEFSWNIGNITRDEITLKYYAYLDGSAEAEREAGLYDTNEYAHLDYNNYLGHKCRQTFPVPTLGWEQAAVSYEFYLVNDLGQPVNREGMVVPFAERVLVTNPQMRTVLLNDSSDIAADVKAADVVPDGYVLYNPDASYHVDVSSGGAATSRAIISDEADTVTTYYYEGNYNYNYDGVVPGITDYTYTHVAFGVRLTLSILPDTVVIDYGLPVKVHVLANDFIYGTSGTITNLCRAVKEDTQLNIGVYSSSMIDDKAGAFGSSVTLDHGRGYIENDYVVYQPTDMLMDEEEVFYYELTTDDGEILYSSVTVIPAANIYYEDSFITFVDNGDYKWQTAGSEYKNVFQAEDRPGTYTFSEYDANNVYGRDAAYDDNTTTYSLGAAKYAEVDAAGINHEPYAEFSFCGTGFDFFSATNSDTGMVLVDVMKNGKAVQKKVVNTYYGYTYGRAYLDENGEVTSDASGEPLYLAPEITPDAHKVDGKICSTTPYYFEEDGETLTDVDTGNPAYASGWVVTEGENGLYQVPVIRIRDLDYDTYDVRITPKYSSMFDMKYRKGLESNSYKIYVDAIRIYDPAGIEPATDDVVGDAYVNDSEFIPQYIEIRNQMISAETFYDTEKEYPEDGLSAGVVFIDGITELSSERMGDLSDLEVSDSYLKSGPNNELYLAKGQAIAFYLVSGRKIMADSLQLGMKTVAGGTSVLTCINAGNDNKLSVTVAGGSEQYRRLSSLIVWDKDEMENDVYQTKYPIIIVNTSDTVCALTTLKWTYSEKDKTEEKPPLMMAFSPRITSLATDALLRTFAEEYESAEVSTGDVTVTWTGGTVEEGGTAELQIVTPMDITAVTVGGVALTECAPTPDGNKVWTYAFTVEKSGDYEYDIILTDFNGNVSDALPTGTITVEPAAEEPDVSDDPAVPDEPIVPDEPVAPEEPGQEEEQSSGVFAFFRRLIERIKEILTSIMGWWK